MWDWKTYSNWVWAGHETSFEYKFRRAWKVDENYSCHNKNSSKFPVRDDEAGIKATLLKTPVTNPLHLHALKREGKQICRSSSCTGGLAPQSDLGPRSWQRNRGQNRTSAYEDWKSRCWVAQSIPYPSWTQYITAVLDPIKLTHPRSSQVSCTRRKSNEELVKMDRLYMIMWKVICCASQSSPWG